MTEILANITTNPGDATEETRSWAEIRAALWPRALEIAREARRRPDYAAKRNRELAEAGSTVTDYRELGWSR